MRALPFLLLLPACTEPALEVVDRVAQAVERRDEGAIRQRLATTYADPLGGEAEVLQDLRGFFERFDNLRIDLEDPHEKKKASELETEVTALLDAELVGHPTWRVIGPVHFELVRQDGWRIRSGLFTELRDAMRLADARRAALEANDAQALAPHLHPRYRDGDLDAQQALARLAHDLDGMKVRLEVTNYRLEIREQEAHLDEHYRMTVNDQPMPPAVARLTLGRNVGRYAIEAGLYPAEAQ